MIKNKGRQNLSEIEQQKLQKTKIIQKQSKFEKLSKNCLKNHFFNKFKKNNSSKASIKDRFLERLNDGSFSKFILQNKFECPICLDLLIEPTLMECGHLYCQRCIEESCTKFIKCSLCRNEQCLEEITPSLIMKSIIKTILIPHYKDNKDYSQRCQEYQDWIVKRDLNISGLQPGQIIDVRTYSNLWKKAVFKKMVINNQEQCLMCEIIGNKQNNIFYTNASSRRIANCGFYTDKNYKLVGENNKTGQSIKKEFHDKEKLENSDEQFGLSFSPSSEKTLSCKKD